MIPVGADGFADLAPMTTKPMAPFGPILLNLPGVLEVNLSRPVIVGILGSP